MKPVTFTLENDPQVYSLQFDFNLLCDAEAETGLNLMHGFMGLGIDARVTRGVLYACLKTAHPAVTLKEAGDLLSKDRETVLEALGKAIKIPTVATETPEAA